MPGIRIRGLTDRRFLAFDLIDLLTVLGESVGASTWKCYVEDFVSADDARPNLGAAYNTSKRLSGTELLALAAETRQVIDGKFEGFRSSDETPWITLEAIDSSFWEISPLTVASFRPSERGSKRSSR